MVGRSGTAIERKWLVQKFEDETERYVYSKAELLPVPIALIGRTETENY